MRATGAVGWSRRRADDSVEAGVYREGDPATFLGGLRGVYDTLTGIDVMRCSGGYSEAAFIQCQNKHARLPSLTPENFDQRLLRRE